MGKPTGFLEFQRELPTDRSAQFRIADWKEFHLPMLKADLRKQGATDEMIKLAYDTIPTYGLNASDISALMMAYVSAFTQAQKAARQAALAPAAQAAALAPTVDPTVDPAAALRVANAE